MFCKVMGFLCTCFVFAIHADLADSWAGVCHRSLSVMTSQARVAHQALSAENILGHGEQLCVSL